ncbi:MAG: NADPH:quinone reductase, Zinc-containing alcohol dehydrogenase superfamily [Thermoleophilia bacterium]|nr:NADPH:quinone reductase, Zinc-containing alcohol dehydrogenase superfamily [Thermoleophilia bacterium]
MRAMVIDTFGGTDQLEARDIDDPKLGPDSIRIRVRSAGVNPVDTKLREGKLDGLFPHHFPVVLGWDVAGEIDAVGPAVAGFEAGMPVWAYCRKTEVSAGSYAELVTVPAEHVAHAPTTIDITDAGAIPLAGLTAWQALEDALGLEEGETLLIGAAAGGVGHLAVQLAAARGARVIGLASPGNHDFVRSLGASEVFDYHRDDLADAVREVAPDGVEAAFDLLGGDSLEVLRSLVRSEGRIASLADQHPAGDRHDITGRYVFVRPSATDLDHLAALIDSGALRVEIAERFPLEEVGRAHERIEEGHTRGKLVLTVRTPA